MIWVFKPYTDARSNGRSGGMGALEMADIVKEVHYRIDEFCGDKAGLEEPSLDYKIMDGGPGWSLVQEMGAQCRSVFLRDGVKAFVSFLGEQDGRFFYAIGRASPLVAFPVPEIYKDLNIAEGIPDEDSTRWNGSMLSGGSPRGRGSILSPSELTAVINDSLKAHA